MVPRMNGRQRSGNFDQAFGQQRVPDIDRLPRLPLNGPCAGRLRGGVLLHSATGAINRAGRTDWPCPSERGGLTAEPFLEYEIGHVF